MAAGVFAKCIISQIRLRKVADCGRAGSRSLLMGLSISPSKVGARFIVPELMSRNTSAS